MAKRKNIDAFAEINKIVEQNNKTTVTTAQVVDGESVEVVELIDDEDIQIDLSNLSGNYSCHGYGCLSEFEIKRRDFVDESYRLFNMYYKTKDYRDLLIYNSLIANLDKGFVEELISKGFGRPIGIPSEKDLKIFFSI